MRLTSLEKDTLYQVLDIITEKTWDEYQNYLSEEETQQITFSIFKKLRLELRGY